jgi:hypothetical protein
MFAYTEANHSKTLKHSPIPRERYRASSSLASCVITLPKNRLATVVSLQNHVGGDLHQTGRDVDENLAVDSRYVGGSGETS